VSADALFDAWLDDPQRGAERMARVRAARRGLRVGDRTALRRISDEFAAWKSEGIDRLLIPLSG
jgi:hypothetical protein